MTEKVDSLITLAEEDFELASQPTTPPRPAAYHISQAVEKAARAVCVFEGVEVGTTHNIGQIGALLPDDHPLRQAIEEQNYQSSASTRFRYPDPAGRLPKELPKEEIDRRLDDARTFIGLVKTHVYGSANKPNGTGL